MPRRDFAHARDDSESFIATDKALFSSEKCYLFYFSTKTYVVGTH